MPSIPALEKRKWEDWGFKVIFGSLVSSRPTWAIHTHTGDSGYGSVGGVPA